MTFNSRQEVIKYAANKYAFLTTISPPQDYGWCRGVLDRDLNQDNSAVFSNRSPVEFMDGYCDGWLLMDEVIQAESV